MATYIALLRKDRDSDFGVDFPDFPGCVTAGVTLDEAGRMAREALRGHVETMIEDGETIPDASGLDDILADPDNRAAIPFLVDVPVARSKPIRVNVILPSDLVEQIDRASPNRSRFLAEAARARLGAATAIVEPTRKRGGRLRALSGLRRGRSNAPRKAG